MESKVGYAARKIEYGIIHPILSQSFLDRFEPLCSKLWSQCIVMFHVGRSGSTVLGDLLNQNKDILWDGEIYHPFLLELRELKKQGWNAEQDAFPFPPIKLVRDRLLLHKLTQFSKRIYGCEVKFFHLKRARIELKNYINYLESLGFSKYLILERKNYLKVIVSSLLSNQKKKSFHIPSQATTQLSRVQIDVNNLKTDGERKTLLEFLKNYRESFQTLENSLQTRRILKLTYEDEVVLHSNGKWGLELATCGYLCHYDAPLPKMIFLTIRELVQGEFVTFLKFPIEQVKLAMEKLIHLVSKR